MLQEKRRISPNLGIKHIILLVLRRVQVAWNERKSGGRKSRALNHRSLIPFAKPPPAGFLAPQTSDIEPIFDYLMGHNGFPIWD